MHNGKPIFQITYGNGNGFKNQEVRKIEGKFIPIFLKRTNMVIASNNLVRKLKAWV